MMRRWLLAGLIPLAPALNPNLFADKPVGASTIVVRHINGQRMSLPGVPNAAAVTPKLYRGAQPTPEGFRELKNMGIDIVVDLRLTGKDKEKREVTSLGMQYVAIPWHCSLPRDKVMAEFLALLGENHEKKVFVHCRYGDDRTGMMIAAYRMANEGWTAEEARKEMNAFGFHRLVCPALEPYEKHFPQHFSRHAAFKGLRVTTGGAGADAK